LAAVTGPSATAGPERPLARCLPSLAEAAVVRVTGYFTCPSRTLVLGADHGCDVEFWTPDGDLLVAPRANATTETVPSGGEPVEGGEELFNPLVSPARRRAVRYPTRPEFAVSLIEDIDFPIDAVYTWVDGADSIWQAKRDAALAEAGVLRESAASEARFTSRDELRYSLRSLTACAPWIRHIWIVTDGQIPSWLDEAHPGVTVVDHKEIFTDPSVLPVFNSHAIETQLHHIDGLSEHFLYLNDDFFLGRPLPAATFFDGNGLPRFFPSAVQVPFGTPELEESPVHAAGMNNRRLLAEMSGRMLTQKMKHVPYALRRSLLEELEERFAAQFAGTSQHRFRECTDVSVVSSLAHYYGYLTGRAIRGSIGYTYVDLAQDRTKRKLRTMLALRPHDAFCLNDTAPTTPEQDTLLIAFLQDYYPTPSPFERGQGYLR
ncbi:MAG TPA: stealth family protein, partial [Thermopolyspora sp.]